MRFAASILSALFLTACMAANVSAIPDPSSVNLEEGESLADKLIQASNDPGVLKSSTGFPSNPDASKQVWANRTGVNFTMPESLSDTDKSAKDSRAEAEALDNQQTEDTAVAQSPAQDTTVTGVDSASAGEASVEGSWYFTLEESTPKEMVLTLFQSGDAIYGTGSINMGDNALAVAASGSVDGESMNLDVTSIGTIGLYRMALDLKGDSASGSYDAFTASGETWEGNAQGTRSVPE
jgi:hypothetical protein